MKKRDFFKRKIGFIGAIFVCTILISLSTAVPATDSTFLKNINGKGEISDKNFSKNTLDILNDEKDKIILNNNINWQFLIKIFSFLKNSKENSLSQGNADEDFMEYWAKYSQALDRWQPDSSFAEWYYDWMGGIDPDGKTHVGYSVWISIILAIIIFIVLGYSLVSNNLEMGWFVSSVILFANTGLLWKYLRCIFSFIELTWREVDILIHVVDEEGNGIPNLSGNIIAYSENVAEDHPNHLNQWFTYQLGPLTESDTSGWYALHTRGYVEKLGGIYYKAPPPPGRWNITIDDIHGPWDIAYLENISIPSGGSYVGEMVLYPDE